MTDIATTYVRIRPNTAGFQAEAQAQLKGAVAGITKGLAFALGAAGIGEGVKKLAEEAAAHQSAVASTQAAVKAVGAEWRVYGKTVTEVLDQQARATGFSFQDLYQGFIRLETQIKNTPKALKALGEAEDVARARHLGLAQAATALARASAGNVQSLNRLGIIIPKSTQAQDALKAKLLEVTHALTAQTQARAKHYAGTIQLTSAEQTLARLSPIQLKTLADNIKAQTAQAKASDLQRSAATALGEVQARYGGQAATFAKTAAGEYARFRVEVELAAAELGKVLLPYLADAARQAGAWARELGSSKSVATGLKTAASDVASGVRSIGAAIKSTEPELKLLGEIFQAVGPGPILAAVAAYKAYGIAVALAGKVTGTLDSLAKKSVATQTAQTVVATRLSAADARLALATQAVTDAQAAQDLVYDSATGTFVATTASVEALTIAQTELAAATEAADVAGAGQLGGMGKLGLASEGLLATLSGPGGLAFAVAGVAGAVYYLSTITPDGVRRTNDLRNAYNDLAKASSGVAAAQREVHDAGVATTAATASRQAASDALARARAQLDAAVQTGKSAEIQAKAADAVTAAEARWRDANSTLITSEHAKRTAIEASGKAIEKQKADFAGLVKAQVSLAAFDEHVGVGARGANLSKNIDDYVRQLHTVIATTKGLTAAQTFQLQSLASYVGAVRKIPDSKTVNLFLNDAQFYSTLQKDLGVLKGAGGALFDAILGKPQADDARGAPALTVAVKKKSGELGAAGATAYTTSFVTTIDASTIAKSLTDAIASARSQLASSGNSLAAAVGAELDARLAATEKTLNRTQKALQDDIAKRQAAQTARDSQQTSSDAALKLKQLQDELGPGALTANQASQLQAAKNAVLDAADAVANARDQAQSTAIDAQKTLLEQQNTIQKTANARRLADLTDELNKGIITQARYVAGVRAELAKQGVSYKSAGALLGRAFADGFRDSLAEIIGQSKALSAVPKGTLRRTPTATKPVSPLAEEAKAIQAVIDQIAGSGGRFNVQGASTLPKGVKLADLVSAAQSQRTETAYREKSGKAQDATVHFTGQTADHTKLILEELRLAAKRPPAVIVVGDGGKAKRKNAQATRP